MSTAIGIGGSGLTSGASGGYTGPATAPTEAIAPSVTPSSSSSYSAGSAGGGGGINLSAAAPQAANLPYGMIIAILGIGFIAFLFKGK